MFIQLTILEFGLNESEIQRKTNCLPGSKGNAKLCMGFLCSFLFGVSPFLFPKGQEKQIKEIYVTFHDIGSQTFFLFHKGFNANYVFGLLC